jgi:protein Tex
MSQKTELSTEFDPIPQLVVELELPRSGIIAVIQLLEEGNTIPFIARYRKEATGNFDEVQIRLIEERYNYIKELEDRRQTILKSVDSQGKLTDELKEKILACKVKNILEDLYLPYKPKRRTKAMIAKEKGLEPLALRILEQPTDGDPRKEAETFVDEEKEVEDVDVALQGARDIVAEIVAENAEIRGNIREVFSSEGVIVSKVAKDKEEEASKFKDYFDFHEKAEKIPSHRYLAIRRGENEGLLDFQIEILPEAHMKEIHDSMGMSSSSPFAEQLELSIADSFQRLIQPSVETDTRVDLKMKSDRDAVDIFAQNLRNLLLAPPLGSQPVIGIDPGLRTGCKCAVVDATGKYLETKTFYITGGTSAEVKVAKVLLELVQRHKPFAIAVGNGTGGRETEAMVKSILVNSDLKDILVVQVSESGASIYSASEIARDEFPDLDLTIRGSISIARRLQDPLAELVKVDPKSIGVGQYQHDVYQPLLQQKLRDVVESCVNFVGVELNTASAELLSYVAGIGPSVAKKIVKFREEKGAFSTREQLLKVAGLGQRTYQQAAGFLRVRESKNPLDSSAVHPEQYKLVNKMLDDLGVELSELIGNKDLIGKVEMNKYLSAEVGEHTLEDIVAELKKPGRDPRESFERPNFRDDVNKPEDLEQGMLLEGIVTNVTAFGAFVDVGVHQDGLVHISQLSNTFVKDPNDIVQVGDKIKVKVLEIDLKRKRISLTAKTTEEAKNPPVKHKKSKRTPPPKVEKKRFGNNPFASL